MAHDPNLNALWCRALAEELRRGGVGHAVLCPGSRNAPLLFALGDAFAGGAWSHLDERSAAFIALGAAKASGRPALVCVTSGSALANCAPALAEAKAARVPLIVVAADRPWELHASGAPQTMPQRGALSAFVDDELALGEPTADDAALRALRARVSRLAQLPGPALIDVPLREPLTPAPDPAWDDRALSREALHGRGADRPYTALGTSIGELAPADLAWWGGDVVRGIDWLRPGLKGVIVAGAGAGGGVPTWPRWLAERTGFPLIADAPGGARDHDDVVCLADALVGGPLGDEPPELIVVVEQAPLTRALYEWVGRQRCPLLLLDHGANRDFLANAWAATSRASPAAWRALADACAPGDAAWRARWLGAERRARARLQALIADEPWGEPLAAHLAVNHPRFRAIHLASSMPVRHANLHLLPRAGRVVLASRGVNGIDGTLATAIGAQRAGAGAPGLLLCGDLAFLHDLPALAALAQPEPTPHAHDLTIVVLNNDGGGIFDFLPVAQAPAYERWVRTPHGLGCEHAARQFGLAYQAVRTPAALAAALDQAAAGGPRVIECQVAPGEAVARHRALVKALASA